MASTVGLLDAPLTMVANTAYREVKKCRICGNSNLMNVLDLGEQYLTGVFPPRMSPELIKGPLQLVKCFGTDPRNFCGLVQLRYSFSVQALYGETYGYRSGLNPSMVEHLHRKVDSLQELVRVGPNDLVLDIGSNDGTLLARYPENGAAIVGFDPSARKFKKYYRPDVRLIVEFFSADIFRKNFGERKAKIVTSIAMFYDLEEPQAFVDDVASVLADDGVWHLEQSYLSSMLRTNSYDTACHEHIEYYALRQLNWMMRQAGLRIIDVQLNSINGGSFAVTVAKENSGLRSNEAAVESLERDEAALALDSLWPFEALWQRILKHRDGLLAFLSQVQREKKVIVGYGASTKGNVLLQFCGTIPKMLPCIAEINEDKFGCVTPGTWIPIVPESEARLLNPDYLLVLPWHFRDSIVRRESAFRARGGKIVFPLPKLDIVS
jgi:SAM-dependent methyltransferase